MSANLLLLQEVKKITRRKHACILSRTESIHRPTTKSLETKLLRKREMRDVKLEDNPLTVVENTEQTGTKQLTEAAKSSEAPDQRAVAD